MRSALSPFAKRFLYALVFTLPCATAAVVAGCGDDDVVNATSQDGGGYDGPVADVNGGSDAGATDSGDAMSPIARGEYLVKHVAACGDCHTPRKADGSPDETKWLAGSAGLFQIPGLGPDGGVGVVSPPNLTPDPTTGLGKWTDDQIKTAFLDGKDSDGKPLFSVMPYFVFHNMSADDANAIVAYLRSIPAVANEIPERNFDVPAPASAVPASAIPDPALPATDPDYASAMRGKYLTGNIGVCMECHTKHLQGGPDAIDTTKLFAGGDDFPSAAFGLPMPPFPPVIFSANITQDDTGLKGWTASDVVTVLKEGKEKGGMPLCPPMPFGPKGAFGGLTDADALDIANYVVHLPPIANTISPMCHEVIAGDGGM